LSSKTETALATVAGAVLFQAHPFRVGRPVRRRFRSGEAIGAPLPGGADGQGRVGPPAR